jgi:hypothetical protein
MGTTTDGTIKRKRQQENNGQFLQGGHHGGSTIWLGIMGIEQTAEELSELSTEVWQWGSQDNTRRK